MRNLLKNKRAEGDFKNIFIALVLFVVFTWLILSITLGIGNEYGRNTSEIGNGALNKVSFQQTAQNISTTSQTYTSQLQSGTIENVDSPTGIWGFIKGFISLLTTPFTLLGQILTNVLGIPALVVNVVLGLLVISLILTGWAVLRAGS
jgi:hypothetical protein